MSRVLYLLGYILVAVVFMVGGVLLAHVGFPLVGLLVGFFGAGLIALLGVALGRDTGYDYGGRDVSS